MLAIWKVERETKEKQAEIDKLMTKVAKLESERDTFQESENLLSEKVKFQPTCTYTPSEVTFHISTGGLKCPST